MAKRKPNIVDILIIVVVVALNAFKKSAICALGA